EPAREGAVPPRVLDPQEQGEAVLPLRGGEGFAHGHRGHGGHHLHVALPRSRARPQGGPDHDHLRAAAGVVLLLPLRGPADHQAGGADAGRRHRRSDDRHHPAGPAAVLRPWSGAPAGAAADRHHGGHPDHPDHGLPDLPGRCRRFAERDRRRGRRPVRARQAGGRAGRLPRLSQDRPQRQRRPWAGVDRHRQQAAQGGHPADAREPDGAHALLLRHGPGAQGGAGRLPRAADRRAPGPAARV
ncbi:MAG: hypothetical protein AVDCRST_MAG69-58, partial [uncultured Solirubrobacteraceae bacterium]